MKGAAIIRDSIRRIVKKASCSGKPFLQAGSQLLNFIFPPFCPGCGLLMRTARGICPRCRITLDDTCGIMCWNRPEAFTYLTDQLYLSEVVTCWDYSPCLENIIHAVKYNGRTRLGIWIGKFAAARMSLHIPETIDLLIPVPLHTSRERERGYNQSGMICRGFGAVLAVPCSSGILRRVKNTATQTSLSGPARQRNAADAFRVIDSGSVKDRSVLLVDDVVTTGATLNSAACALVRAGASHVCGAALARPVLGCVKVR